MKWSKQVSKLLVNWIWESNMFLLKAFLHCASFKVDIMWFIKWYSNLLYLSSDHALGLDILLEEFHRRLALAKFTDFYHLESSPSVPPIELRKTTNPKQRFVHINTIFGAFSCLMRVDLSIGLFDVVPGVHEGGRNHLNESILEDSVLFNFNSSSLLDFLIDVKLTGVLNVIRHHYLIPISSHLLRASHRVHYMMNCASISIE